MNSELNKIVDRVLKEGREFDSPGLLDGQMGMAVFMFHYARWSGDEAGEDFGCELIESVQRKIYRYFPVDYVMGLAGIGTGISYLIRHRFLEADGNDILSDFDLRVFQELMLWQNDRIDLYSGVAGWMRYFCSRLKEYEGCGDNILTMDNKHYLLHIIDYFYSIRKKVDAVIGEEVLSVLYDLYGLNLYPSKVEKLMCYYLGKAKLEAKDDPVERGLLLDEVKKVKRRREVRLLQELADWESRKHPWHSLRGSLGKCLAEMCGNEPDTAIFLELL